MREWLKLFESEGDDYFSAEAWEHARSLCSGNARSTIIHMSPDDYLTVAKDGHDPSKEYKVNSLVHRGVKFNELPMLQFEHDGEGTAEVVGHEGRHRARALKAAGVTSMPVLFLSIANGSGASIRWNALDRPSDRDFFREDWPQRLYKEEKPGVYIAFPIADQRPEGYQTTDHPLNRPPRPAATKAPPTPEEIEAAKRREREETDELLRKLRETKETFTNEFDREITVEVEPRDNKRDGKTTDGIWIDMIGPDSEAENHITRQEAEVMYRLLGDALRDVENRVCKTPGANYNTHFSDNEVSISVELPPEVEVPDLDDSEMEEYEDRMHDAMEEILADMLKDADWDEARRNDPVTESEMYHGSNREDFDGVLHPRTTSQNPTWKGLNYLGAWFTSTKEMAYFYAKMPGGKTGPVHTYEMPVGQFWDADSKHQFAFVVQFTHLMEGIISPDEITHVQEYKLRYLRDMREIHGRDHQTTRLYERAEAIAVKLIQNHEFMMRVKEALEQRGFVGIVWKHSRIDQNYLPEAGPHTVYLVFHDEPLRPIA